MRKIRFTPVRSLSLWFVILLFAGCAASTAAPPPTVTATREVPQPTPAWTSTPSPPPSPTATLPPLTATPIPKPSPLVTCLVYSVNGALWRVAGPGQVVALNVPYSAELSPDGTQAVYIGYEAGKNMLVWKDVVTGAQRQLPDVGKDSMGQPLWWPARPEWIIVGSASEADSYGFLSVIRSDGSEFQILDTACMCNSIPDPSPDGKFIAYDRCGAPWLYRWGSGPEPLDLTDFGFTLGKNSSIGSPAWSPDGTRLAWVIGGDLAGDGGWHIGILLLDLIGRTHDIMFDYEPVGRGGWPPAPVWSPDGQWLAFQIWGEDGYTRVVRADDKTDVHLLGRGRVVWSPDGLRLAYDDGGLMIVDVATWQPQPGLPLAGTEPVAWLASTTAHDLAAWDVVTDTFAAPNGAWFAQQTTAYPRPGRGDRLHKLLTVNRTDGERTWTLVDVWEESALGMTTLRPLQWGRLGRALYLSHVTIPDGCPGLINGSDLLRFDVDSGTLTEYLPPLGRTWMRLSPDERTLAYGALTLRDLATGEERHVPLDVPEDATVGHIVWSQSWPALALTIVEGHCGPPEARVHTIVHVDTHVLGTTVPLVDGEHGFVTVGWPEGNNIQLEDRNGETWWLDVLSGEFVPDAEAATLLHDVPVSVCQTFQDWVRPTEEEQAAEIWSLPRYRDVPLDKLRETFRHNFYRYHGGASELSMWGEMGLWNTENVIRCGETGHQAILDGKAIELWVTNHRVLGVRRTGNVYTVAVVPADGFQVVQIPGIGRRLEKTEFDPTVIRFVTGNTLLGTLPHYPSRLDPLLVAEEYPIVSADVDSPTHVEYLDRLTPAILDVRREWRTQAIHEGEVMIGDDHLFIAAGLHTVTVYNGDTAVYTHTFYQGQGGPLAVRLSSWDDRWVLEAIPGKVIVGGESLNKRLGYDEIFGWRLLSGKPFFFFVDEAGIGLSYDGQVLPYRYDEVPHYLCCEPAFANPGDNETMVWFHGLRDGVWYYIEVGIYE